MEYEDTTFPSSITGIKAVERILRLQANASDDKLIIDDSTFDENDSGQIGILYHLEGADGELIPNGRGAGVISLDEETNTISSIYLTKEHAKRGETDLITLKYASKIIEAASSFPLSSSSETKDSDSSSTSSAETEPTAQSPLSFGGLLGSNSIPNSSSAKGTLAEQYFGAWNDRDMDRAVSLFTDDVKYDDTAFPEPFQGKEKLDKHLKICANAFPVSFSFIVDKVIDGRDKITVQWHVENKGEQMPFTRGVSFYTVEAGKISTGIDFLEPSVFKTGELAISAKNVLKTIQDDKTRLIPVFLWAAYMYVVFFSDWFFGLPATALEERTWLEVRDLSLNFFLVSPILKLPFAPVVHPMLEGIFNLLLSWAAMFAGFLSDDRDDKPNVLPMLPTVAGMQFLTSAFLLPYLATRSVETKSPVYKEGLSAPAQLAESPLLGASMAFVGCGSVFWGLFARADDFGDLSERWTSLLQLLSIDRVGSSFIVDLIIFGLFQGWFIDDDVKRRGGDPSSLLARAGKYIPFLGMAAYLSFRPQLTPREEA